MLYMLTGTEVLFLKDLVEQLSGLADTSDYTREEVEMAIELLNKLQPVETEQYLDFIESFETTEED